MQDEARYGLHSAHRRCWGLRGSRVVKPSQQKYEWSYVYGALEVVEGGGVFCYMPTVTLEHAQAFLEQIAQSDPEAEHVVIWDGAGFHHRPGDERISERVFETLDAIEEKITEALRPYWEQPVYARSLVGDGWLHTQANATPAKFMPNSL
ncbi:MAG: transposase [Kiritimatiellales bacterium]|nr:transposase [Kiritimatiellales bacterium]